MVIALLLDSLYKKIVSRVASVEATSHRCLASILSGNWSCKQRRESSCQFLVNHMQIGYLCFFV